MNIFMHLAISRTIRKTLEREFQIKFNALRFSFGNIKPDILPLLINIPHFKGTAMEFVKTEIKELFELRLHEPSQLSKDFSERMGILTHYLSDFFCYAHSDLFVTTKRSHVLYELRLSSYFNEKLKHLKLISFNPQIKNISSAESLVKTIEDAHDYYVERLGGASCLEWDTLNTLKVTLLVCSSILSKCIENNVDLAA